MEKFGTQVLSKISMEISSLLNIQTKTINIKLKIVGLKKVDGDITTALSHQRKKRKKRKKRKRKKRKKRKRKRKKRKKKSQREGEGVREEEEEGEEE